MSRKDVRTALLSSASVLALSSASFWPITAFAQSLPTNGSVVSGAVGIAQSASKLTVTQSSATGIVNWSTFSIGQGNQVSFQNGSGATLNRVTGNVPSSLNGLLTATGSVYLINPAGIAVGPTGVIKTGGSFVGSTLDITDDKFRAGGSLTFSGNSAASVVNLGKIGSSRGDVVLIAQQVENAGSIRARNGTVGLASGTEVTIRDQEMADGKIAVSLPAANGSVRNTGSIRGANAELRANGGNVYALGLNTRSVIKATGVANRGGRVFLTATGGNVTVSSRVSAQRKQTAARKTPKDGGQIVITGDNVTLANGAKLDASGQTGGTILIGGDRQGGAATANNFANFQIANAQNTTVEAGVTMRADGSNGNGGNVVVWSDGATSFAGTISATGGATSGNGGSAEVSGHFLNYSGIADLRAPAGKTGTLLLDPYDLTIDASAAATISANLGTADVLVQTTASSASSPGVANSSGSGDITVNSGISWSSANRLTLDAYRSVNINAPIVASGAGKVTITTNDGGSGGDYSFGTSGSLKFTGTEGSGQALTINGNSYNLIYTRAELAAIGTNTTTLAQRYALANNLDLSGSDFAPIGTLAVQFTGVFEGAGNTIANLTQTNQASSSALFGSTQSATLRDFNMTNVSLTNDGSGAIPTYVGAVVGYADNNAPGGTTGTTLKNISVSGNISINHAHGQNLIGGAIGVLEGFGTATNIRSSVNVTQTGSDVAQTANIGGLVGSNSGTITQSYASGAVSGVNTVGGFAGLNDGTITQSYSTGNVALNNPAATAGSADSINGTIALFAGGFVGVNGARGTGVGTITQSYATGAVNVNAGSNRPGTLIVTSMAGGFAGTNTRRFTGDSINGGTINEVYATGYVGGNATQTGGIVGKNSSTFTGGITGTVTNAYWDTQTTGQTTVTGDAGASTANGKTTAQLQGTLPSGFNTVQSGVWSTSAGLYPYLAWRYPTAPQTISGRAYSDSGATALKGGSVSVAMSGTDIGTASTGANGYYYLLEPAGTIPSGGAATVGYINGGNGGARVATLTGTTTNFDIWGATLIAPTSASTLSAALAISPAVENATLIANATSGNSAAAAAVAGLSQYGYVASGGFTIDQTVSKTGGDGLYVKTLAGDITVANPVTIADGGLTLDAFHSVNINSNIVVSGAGRVTLATNDGGTGGDYNFASGKSLKFTGAANSGQALTINGDDYNLIFTAAQLQALNTDTTTLSQKYAVARDIDASGVADFEAIGSDTTPNNFTGTLAGLNNTVDRLTSTGAANGMAGLFGWNFAGTLRDLKLTNVAIGGASALEAGGAVAQMAASGTAVVQNVSVVGGTVSATTLAGGVVGENGSTGTISQASAINVAVSESTSNMSAYRAAGGVVGRNFGSITQSYATGGSVSAMKQAGGFVGINYGTISQSYATGAVTLSPLAAASSGESMGAGGFVGVNVVTPTASAATITQSFATGSVTLNNANATNVPVGSFVGGNGGTITEAYGTGYLSIASGSGTIGGFSGAGTAVNAASQTKIGTLTNTYYDTQTTGQSAQSGGRTTAQLQGTLPANFNTVQSGVWSTSAGRYPYLSWRFATAPDVVSGKAYSDHGITTLGGSGVNLLVNGSAIATATGANGYYYFFTDAGAVSGSSGVLAALTGTTKGNTFTDTAISGTMSGLDIYGSTLRLVSADANYSTVVGNLSTALGSNTGANYLFTTGAGPTIALKSNTNLEINSSAGSLNVDQSVAASGTGTVTVMADDMNLSNAVTTAGTTVKLMTTTAGRGITLGGSAAGTLSLSNAELNNVTASTLQVGSTGNDGSASGAISIAGSIAPAGITSLKLSTGSSISETAGTVTVANLAVTGTAVTMAQNNSVATLAVNASGNVSFANSGALTIGSVGGINGVTAGGTATIVAGGNLTLDATDGAVSAVGSGDALQLATGGVFTNNKGSSALSVTGGGRWLVWSGNPANDTRGGLTYGFKQYNATYGTTTVAQATGNGFLYTLAPVVTASLAANVSKVYDGTTAATLTPSNFTTGGTIDGDTVNITNSGGSFSQRDAGTNLTLTVTGISVASATNGAATVYGYQVPGGGSASINTASITAKPLTITATKTYDQSASFTLPQLSLSGVISGDTATLSGSASVSSANANTYNSFATNTLTVSNSNYAVTGAGVTVAATINKAPLTVTATKTYDALATFTTGQLALSGFLSGDAGTITGGSAAVSSANAGTYNAFATNTLTVSNANYTAAGAGVTALATISKAPLTITAATNSKTYDGTISAAATPTVAGLQGTTDTVTGLTETYDNKNAGSGKTLSVSAYTINDGNSGNNYNVTTVANTTGSIATANLTVTAVANTKGYDGTTTASATPTVTGLKSGDTVTGLSESYDDKNAGAGKTLAVSGFTLNDGNGGNNYTVSKTTSSAGVITAASVTVTADAVTKFQGAVDPALTYMITKGSLVTGDAFSGVLARAAGEAIGDYQITQGTLGLGQNYVLTYVGANLTIQPVAPSGLFGSFSTPLNPSPGQNDQNLTSGTGNQPGNLSVGDNSGDNTNPPLFCSTGATCSQMPFQANLQYGQWIHFTGPQQ